MPTVNIKAFSHKKSTVIENGGPKLPTAAQLELGEIAINFAKGYETLSIKNNNNEIVTFTNDNYWINKELAIAAALNDLNDRKQDALEMDETPTEGSENVVTSGGLYSYITEIEQVTAAALNDLNDRITSLALSDDYTAAAQGTPPLAGDTYETAISKLHKVIVDDELITSSALNDLNSRIDNLSLSEDYEAADPASEPAGGDTYEEAISKLHGAILENELATSAALNDLNTRISDIVVPDLILSEDYEPSSLSNLDLFLEPGDSYETAFSKLEKTINDNENITSAALTDLDSRLNLLHLPQSLDDIPDGSTRKLSDYATTTSVNSSLATKQNTLVSGTNIKTINNQSLLGSGNITIQGGSGGDINVIETVKVNGTALTPDANKAVDIPITNEKYGNGLAVQTDDGSTQNITASLTDYALTKNGRVSVILTHDLLYGATLNINNTGVKAIYDASGQVLTEYNRKAYAGDIITVVYDGTNYRLVNSFHATEFSSYIESDLLTLTLTDDSADENIKLCTFTRSSGHPVITPFDPFDPLDMIWYDDLVFSNPQYFEVAAGLGIWTFSNVSENPANEKIVSFLRIFHLWDPTYQGGIERTFIDTNYSPDIIERVIIKEDLIVDVTDIDNDSGTTNYSVSEILAQKQAGRNVYIRFNALQLPLVFSDSSKLIYAMTVAADSVTNLNLPPAILSVVQEGTTATFYLFPFNSIAFTGVDIPIEEISESLLDSTLTPGIYKVTGSNALMLNTEYPYIVIVGSYKTTFIDINGTTTTNYISQTQVRGNDVSYRSKDITNNGEWTSWESILNLLENRINTLETNVAYTADLAAVATSGSYNDLSNKPTIPSAVTESTVSGWGFTKNGGTITGITMNGASKGTSGVVNLGTVITSETALSKGTTTGNGNAVTDISVSGHQITLTKGTTFLTSHQGIKTLKTDNTTAQSTSSSETIAGSGTINLHKVAKTGTYDDLIGKPTIPAAQVQSDWNATSGMGVILNKPTIPTVNNATLTIQKNGTTVNTFTANASSNVTANIQVNELPTVSSSDNGKILQVVNGAWSLVMPTAIYSGTSAPDSNIGNNGDIYVQQ